MSWPRHRHGFATCRSHSSAKESPKVCVDALTIDWPMRQRTSGSSPPVEPTIAVMTAQIAAGHPEALCGFYRSWFDTIFTEARRATGRDESYCLDVVQDAMRRVIRSMKPNRLRTIRRQLLDLVAVGGLGMLIGIAAWVIESQRPSDRPPGGEGNAASPPAHILLVRHIDDSEFLKMLAEIGRPAGLVLSGSRVWLTNAVTDAELGLREPLERKPPA